MYNRTTATDGMYMIRLGVMRRYATIERKQCVAGNVNDKPVVKLLYFIQVFGSKVALPPFY